MELLATLSHIIPCSRTSRPDYFDTACLRRRNGLWRNHAHGVSIDKLDSRKALTETGDAMCLTLLLLSYITETSRCLLHGYHEWHLKLSTLYTCITKESCLLGTAFSTFAGRPSCRTLGTLESPVACDTLPVSLFEFVSCAESGTWCSMLEGTCRTY